MLRPGHRWAGRNLCACALRRVTGVRGRAGQENKIWVVKQGAPCVCPSLFYPCVVFISSTIDFLRRVHTAGGGHGCCGSGGPVEAVATPPTNDVGMTAVAVAVVAATIALAAQGRATS